MKLDTYLYYMAADNFQLSDCGTFNTIIIRGVSSISDGKLRNKKY